MNSESFVNLPKVYPRRSKFLFTPTNSTTLNIGDLVPLYKPIEVIPGDTFKVKTGDYLDLTPMVHPVFDTLFFDVYWFYVPFRLLWSNYIYFYGENKQDPYDSINVYSIPQVKIPVGGYNVGTIANYFGIRPGIGSTDSKDIEISSLAFRAYAVIVNEYFIADYLDSKANTNYDIDATVTGSNGDDYVTDLVLGGKPFKANKLHDKFTSALPKPQAGESVPIPLGELNVDMPVLPRDDISNLVGTKSTSNSHLNWAIANRGAGNDEWSTLDSDVGIVAGAGANGTGFGSLSRSGDYLLAPDNLSVNVGSSFSTNANINDLREAIIIQQMLEAESRHGNRYFEQLVGDYGVVNDDLRLFRPEYLGGSRFSINVNQIPQTSASQEGSPQGNLTAYSVTTYSHEDFTKSFKEPGILIVLGCCRYRHSYPQGLDKFFTKKDKYDFYNHHFEGMGEQPILNKEIYFTGTDIDDEVFGFMPYGTEYRELDSIETGEMSPDYSETLDSYHYGDDYESTPALSSEWLKEDVNNVNRSLVYPSTTVANFRCNFQFKIEAWRPLSMYGVPGLRRL